MDRDRDYHNSYGGAGGGGYDGGHRRMAGRSTLKDQITATERLPHHARKRILTDSRTSHRLWIYNGAVDATPAATIQGRVHTGGRKAQCKLCS